MNKEAKELQIFANALRAALDLCPLYGADESFGGVETVADPFGGSTHPEWFEAAPEPKPLSRDEWRDAQTTVHAARRRPGYNTLKRNVG
jgi:asparagine synthetase B (glutamine-hydrolysing)